MLAIVVATFVLGYAAIVLEHPLRLDKAVPALLAGVLCWVFVAVGDLGVVNELHQMGDLKTVLMHHLSEIAQILIFLMGAMVIVELVDLHQGFSVITNRIKTTKKPVLLWLVATMAFFLSSVLDNLTTTIVFISLLRRLIPVREERIWYVCFVIIAANAGGAWTPIGDVTTTMLWIGEKVTTAGLMAHLLVPSVLCIVVPCLLAAFVPVFRGNIQLKGDQRQEELLSSKTMLAFGVGGLIFVPVFKAVTGLPPYMGMMLSLAVIWLVSEYVRPTRHFTEADRPKYSVRYALSRIELSSILFFLGILLAVGALDSVFAKSLANGQAHGFLTHLAEKLGEAIPNLDIVVVILGLMSAVIDNVPLVAAVMGMYPMEQFPIDSKLWQFIAYTAGTGGSILVIGSAAGVAAMGMERIDFIWYFKRIAWLALAGYFAGVIAFLVLYGLFFQGG